MWFTYAFTFALITSLSSIIAKRVMKDMSEVTYLFLVGIFTLPFLFLIILFFYQIPSFDNIFLFTVLGSILLDVVAAICAYKAIKISDISLVAPMAAFNPVFTAIISFFTIGEVISSKGWLGIALVCTGAYLLQIVEIKKGLLYPFKAVLSHKGIRLSLIAYFIWAITPIFQKTAILHTTPQVPPFASLVGMIGTTTIFGILAFKTLPDIKRGVKKFLPILILVSILVAIGQAAAFMAFSLTNLGSVTAVFKLSVIFTVILGWLFLKEKNIQNRLLGSIVMLIGVFLLVT